MTPEDIAVAVGAELDKRHGEHIAHKEHHEFIEAMIEKERRKQEMWEKVKAHVLGWGIVAIVGGLGTVILKQISK